MDTRRSMLIVDRSAESREVLRAVFEPRGLHVLEASEANEGLALARRHLPDVIVLDPDLGRAPAEAVAQAFERQTAQQATRLVVLGNARLRIDAAHGQAARLHAPHSPNGPHLSFATQPASAAQSHPQGEYLSKPYHYAPLIRRIESLLASVRTSSAKAA